MKNVQLLWATPLFESSISESTRESSLRSVLALREHEMTLPNGNKGDLAGSWVTRDDLQTLPEFQPLVAEIMEFVNANLDFLTVERSSAYITCMWSNVTPVGVSHLDHIHPNCLYSGVIYLQTPKGSSGTFFKDPRPTAQWFKPPYRDPSPHIIGQDLIVLPQEGKMLMWPSWLSHGVESTKYSTDLRVSLSFNVMLRSQFNIHTTKLDTTNL